jgi:hypothetical protein
MTIGLMHAPYVFLCVGCVGFIFPSLRLKRADARVQEYDDQEQYIITYNLHFQVYVFDTGNVS